MEAQSSVRALFLDRIRESLAGDALIKISLGNYKGNSPQLKNIYIKPVLIKRVMMLSFTLRYQTKDITKNFTPAEAMEQLGQLLSQSEFRIATLFTTQENIICSFEKGGDWRTRKEKATAQKPAALSHDKPKERKLQQPDKPYLQQLRLTDADGKVFKNAQDKWKQINHYIEILSTMLAELPQKEKLQVVDMGAGKGYLTFALYDYLNNVIAKPAQVVGVEYRADLVELCNGIAADSGFADLAFVQGTIEDYSPAANLDVLIALHACDTATDDAIAKGIHNGAELIVVAPCCHKQIRREMEANKAKNELDFLLQHGIFMERQAEMVTDGIRALILEYFGYQTKVFQFVSDAHTPKNVLVVGVKKEVNPAKQEAILAKIKETKMYFGIGKHYLEGLVFNS